MIWLSYIYVFKLKHVNVENLYIDRLCSLQGFSLHEYKTEKHNGFMAIGVLGTNDNWGIVLRFFGLGY